MRVKAAMCERGLSIRLQAVARGTFDCDARGNYFVRYEDGQREQRAIIQEASTHAAHLANKRAACLHYCSAVALQLCFLQQRAGAHVVQQRTDDVFLCNFCRKSDTEAAMYLSYQPLCSVMAVQ
jgi:hypothetical protein